MRIAGTFIVHDLHPGPQVELATEDKHPCMSDKVSCSRIQQENARHAAINRAGQSADRLPRCRREVLVDINRNRAATTAMVEPMTGNRKTRVRSVRKVCHTCLWAILTVVGDFGHARIALLADGGGARTHH